MEQDLRFYQSAAPIDEQDVLIMFGFEDIRTEYFIVLFNDKTFDFVSHRAMRAQASEPEEEICEVDQTMLADTLVIGLDRHDPWGKEHLSADTLFRDLHDGVQVLKNRVRRLATTAGRALFRTTLESMRRKARTLSVKQLLDNLAAQIDVTDKSLAVLSDSNLAAASA